jgi:murein DD-endopeptidase MepM/ murein hydrolase activator NlpD
MDWNQVMNDTLHPIDGVGPHVTSEFGRERKSGSSPHLGVDFNYNNGLGQGGINLTNPPVYSPVAGKVDGISPEWGLVSILMDDGLQLQILHMDTILVTQGQVVTPGVQVGTM